MRVGVISDTHLHGYSSQLKLIYDTYFRDVDIILHAGDIIDAEVLEVFASKPVIAVAGNMDRPKVRQRFSVKQVIPIEGFTIGLIHGWGDPKGIEDRIRKEFTNIDCLVYGHTHTPVNHMKNGLLFFNPGSATERFYTNRNSVGILEI